MTAVSDPYGNSPQNPYGGQPNQYGAPQGGGYGPPTGGLPPAPGGYDAMPPKTDGLSIAALVTSLLCCLAPIGVILGIVGLGRTKNGQRKGRGLAVSAIVIGVLMSIGTAVAGAALFIFADSLVTPDNAEVGQCVDISKDDNSIVMRKKECTEKHDAEIVGVAKVTKENLSQIETGMAAYCLTAIDKDDIAKLGTGIGDVKAVIEDPKKVSVGDHLVCYYEPGKKLDKSVL